MKYRHEKSPDENRPSKGWRGVVLWLVSFPGYIIFLLSWLGVLVAAGARLAAWFIPSNSQPPHVYPAAGGGGQAVLGPVLGTIAGIAIALVLATIYWLSVEYTRQGMMKVADFLSTSVWIIKLIGLPLGCGLASIAAMLFRPAIGLTALAAAAGLSVIGLCSFGLEYAFLRDQNKNPSIN